MDLSKKRLLSAMHLGGLTPKEVVIRTWAKIGEHEILTRTAAISFYAIAALVPFLALTITLTAWFLPWIGSNPAGEPSAASTALAPLHDLLTADAASVVDRELASLQQKPPRHHLVRPGGLALAVVQPFRGHHGRHEPHHGRPGDSPLLESSPDCDASYRDPGRDPDRRVRHHSGLAPDSRMAGTQPQPDSLHAGHACSCRHSLRHDPLELLGGIYFGPDADQHGNGSRPAACSARWWSCA